MGRIEALRAVSSDDRAVAVSRARTSFAEGRWTEARDLLAARDDLRADDLELRGTIGFLIGDARAYFDDLAAAFRSHEEPTAAARCAVWLGIMHLIGGEAGHSAGWMSSARRLVTENGPCAASAYLEVMPILRDVATHPERALETAAEVNRVARTYDDVDAVALTGQTLGQLLIRVGRPDEGRALMDEAMVAATSGQLSSPLVEILVYLAVIEGCDLLFDVVRAREWTRAMDRLRAASPELRAFRDVLALYRARVLLQGGRLTEAQAALDDVHASLLLGGAAAARGDLARERGDLAAARTAYDEAAAQGTDATPGRVRLQVRAGDPQLGHALARRSLAALTDVSARAALLPAAIEAAVGSGSPGASDLVDELDGIASRLGSPLLQARAEFGRGQVLVAGAAPDAALPHLLAASAGFRRLEAPLEARTCHELTARAYAELDDQALAALEREAAAAITRGCDQEPAAPAVQLTPALSVLTAREREVLGILATGATNRAIAEQLTLSPRTVDRHVSNILAKIEATSRAAAAAYAIEHGLA